MALLTCPLSMISYQWHKLVGESNVPFFFLCVTQKEFRINAGHYVPQLAELVYDRNKDKASTYINLKGFMVRIWRKASFDYLIWPRPFIFIS